MAFLAGSSTCKHFSFRCRNCISYNFSGFLPPIGKGRKIYNADQTLPVKFRLAGYDGDSISTAEAELFAINEDTGDTLDIGVFRYDEGEGQYIYNLKLPVLGGGEWTLRVELDDGKSYEIDVAVGE